MNILFLSIYFIIIINILSFSLETYTKCEDTGICYISQDNKFWSEIEPGYSFGFSLNETLITIKKEDINYNDNDDELSIQYLPSYSKKGLLKGSKEYECAGGLNECVNSCCNKGICQGISLYCNTEEDKIIEIYIIIGSIFAFLIIVYWLIFVIMGCHFNSNKEKYYVLKKNQGYEKIKEKNLAKEEDNNNINNDERLLTLKNNTILADKAKQIYNDNVINESIAKSDNGSVYLSKLQSSNDNSENNNDFEMMGNNIETITIRKRLNNFATISNSNLVSITKKSEGESEDQKDEKLEDTVERRKKWENKDEIDSIHIDNEGFVEKKLEY